MRLRAIGGPRDGEWVNVPDLMRRQELIRLPETEDTVRVTPRQIEGTPTAFRHVHYRLEQLNFRFQDSDRTLEFLVYHDELRLIDALARVLTRWGPLDGLRRGEVRGELDDHAV